MASSGDCDAEGDALPAWKANLTDPSSLLQSWGPTPLNPCTWFHVTCNTNNSVVRVDLADAELSGILVSELGLLTNLQHLNVSDSSLLGKGHGTRPSKGKLISERNRKNAPFALKSAGKSLKLHCPDPAILNPTLTLQKVPGTP